MRCLARANYIKELVVGILPLSLDREICKKYFGKGLFSIDEGIYVC
jgi:hypothetical protein